jgi:hypothetical protein
MKSYKSFVIGFLVACVLCTTTFVYADEVVKSIDVVLNSINICVNNKKVAEIGESYSLNNEGIVPFSIMYKGTTYVPIRKVSQLLEKEVVWNKETKTAHINDKVEKKSKNSDTATSTIKKDKLKPNIVEVMAQSGTTVEVTFSEKMDKTLAVDVSNYKIYERYGNKKNLDILKVEYDSNNTKVILTTSGQKGATLYSVEVNGVMDLAGNIMESDSKTFVGMPSVEQDMGISDGDFKVKEYSVLSNTEIELKFNKILDKNSAENISNYVINQRFANKEKLDILKAEINESGNKVKLTTKDQKGNFLFLLEISNIYDVSGKELKDIKLHFVGFDGKKRSLRCN